MKITGKVLSLLGASCLFALAGVAPAEAAPKPCCYNNGEFFPSTPSTCNRYGGRIVPYDRCYRGSYSNRGSYGYDDNDRVTFSISIGDIAFGYNDGYYDRHRRWHRWQSDRHHQWWRKHQSHRYHGMRRDADRHHGRRDWRHGRRQNWN